MSFYTFKLCSDARSRVNQCALELLAIGQLTDCVLKSLTASDETEEFPCHSLILCSYSPYLQQCFTRGIASPTRESFSLSSRTICLDIETIILQNIIKLIYYGECQVLEYDAEDMQTALRKLKVGFTFSQPAGSPGSLSVVPPAAQITSIFASSPGSVITKFAHPQGVQLKRRLTSAETSGDSVLNNSGNSNISTGSDSNNINTSSDTFEPSTDSDDEKRRKISLSKTAPAVVEQSLMQRLLNIPELSEANDHQQAEEARYTCKICGKIYQYDISLNKHMKTAHRNVQ